MFKEFFEDTVAADIAQATTGPGKMKRQGKHGKNGKHEDGECPCKKDPMSEECQKKRGAMMESTREEERVAIYMAECIEAECNNFDVLGTFKEQALMTRDAGIVIRDVRGNEYQVTIVQTR